MTTPYSSQRNVTVYGGGIPPDIVAGFIQHGRVTISTLYNWMQIFVQANEPWLLFPATAQLQPVADAAPLAADSQAILQTGTYVMRKPDGQLLANTFVQTGGVRHRTQSYNISGTQRTNAFRTRVRERDDRCCISGKRVYSGIYTAHRCAHIFPVAHADIWNMLSLSDHIEDDASADEIGPTKINSIQNGLLLRSDLHDQFDSYFLAINPDENYRIYDFTPDGEFDGGTLWINQAVPPKYRPSDALLREHFRQCILANIRGAGERLDQMWDPEAEHDLQDVATWGTRVGGYSRLELEMAHRLNSLVA